MRWLILAAAVALGSCGSKPSDNCLGCDGGAGICIARPNPMDFGQVGVGQTEIQALQLTNVGDLPLDVLGAKSDQPEFSVSGSFPVLLQPADSASLAVRFTPVIVDGGEENASLSIQTDSEAQPTLVVPVSGQGV